MDGQEADENAPDEDDRPSGLSSQVLDYYKRFGRHRNLEQYFSLNTVQGDLRDPRSEFWCSMKSQPDSDSQETASVEVCHISISCTAADPQSSQEGTSTSEKQDTDSPPIISEDPSAPPDFTVEKDEEHKSDLDTSRKSIDINLDNSTNKPQSPTSSITSQRKLEWDSLADVGYSNEAHRKVSSSLSTLERLALHQQFSISDDIKNISGHPAAYSTPLDEGNNTSKNLKKGSKKMTKVKRRGIEVVEVNVDEEQTINMPNVNVNVTKHISFNVDPETGAASMSSSKPVQNINLQTEEHKNIATATVKLQQAIDKKIQTSQPGTSSDNTRDNTPPNMFADCIATVPVFLNVDMLKQARYKGLRYYRTKMNKRKKRGTNQQRLRRETRASSDLHEKSIPPSEVTIGCSQVSETDSFEYMPAHVYHQNTARNKTNDQSNTGTSNKTSSLDSSGGYTTLSSKQSGHSLTRDLEHSITLLNKLIQHRHQGVDIKKKLVEKVVKRLIKTNYRDDETATDLLSGLSFNSKLLGLGARDKPIYNTTTSTSDGNNSGDTGESKPRKPILRSSKIQTKTSVGDSCITKEIVAQIHNPPNSKAIKATDTFGSTSTTTGSGENTAKEKSTSEGEHQKTSSELLYQRYLEALKREQKYKEQLRVKQELMNQKCKKSAPPQKVEVEKFKMSSLNDLVKDLTNMNMMKSSRNAGDAPQSNPESYRNWNQAPRFRNHSVFTMSSVKSDKMSNSPSSSKQHQLEDPSLDREVQQSSREDKNFEEQNLLFRKSHLHYCCCPFHSTKEKPLDSAVVAQVQAGDEEIKNRLMQSENLVKLNLPSTSNKFVCFCSSDSKVLEDIPDNFLIYKCCRPPYVANRESQDDVEFKKSVSIQCGGEDICTLNLQNNQSLEKKQSPVSSPIYCETVNPMHIKQNKFCSEQNIYCNQSFATGDANVYRVEQQKGRKLPPEYGNIPGTYTSTSTVRIPKIHSAPQTLRTRIPQHHRLSETVNLIDKLYSIGHVDTCIQTSVSIDPKVSEPTLADINILSEELATSEEIPEPLKHFQNVTTDAYAIPKFEYPFVHSPYPVNKYKKENMPRRQPETAAILDQILTYDEINMKSKDSHCSQQSFSESLFAYLDEEKSEDSPEPSDGLAQAIDIDKQQYVQILEEAVTDEQEDDKQGRDFLKQEQSTSMTAFHQRETFTHDVRAGPSARSSKDVILQASSVNREISTQVTPREDKENLKKKQTDKENAEKKKTKEESRNSSNTKILTEKLSNDYTTEWVDKRNKQDSLITKYESENENDDKIVSADTLISVEQSSNERIRNKNVSKAKQKRTKKCSETSDVKTSEINSNASTATKEALIESIEDIIRRYGKDKLTTTDKRKSRHKHYKDIIKQLQYLLHTENTSADELRSILSVDDGKELKVIHTATSSKMESRTTPKEGEAKKMLIDKSTQLNGSNSHANTRPFVKDESSDLPTSSDLPDTSETSFTCHVINKIRKECDRYKKKHCKCLFRDHSNTGYEGSSGTSVHQQVSESHHTCKSRCSRNSKHSPEKCMRKSIAYNLIVQPSSQSSFKNSLQQTNKKQRKLKDVVVIAPSIEKSTHTSQRTSRSNVKESQYTHIDQIGPEEAISKEGMKEREEKQRSTKHSVTESESDLNVGIGTSGGTEVRKIKFLTVQEYLERNRPDFVNNSNERQKYIQVLNESRQQQQNLYRQLVSLQLEQGAGEGDRVTQLRDMARRLGHQLRQMRPEPKFLDERAMKHHTRKIYRSLPEVVEKKEKIKKDNIKRTNKVITSLFNKNLQKRTLSGVVDISNYSPVIKL